MIYTIGHSTRTIDDFIELLSRNGVRQLGDVRTIPKSRRHPHFAREALEATLPAAGVAYRHFPGLGGLRKPRVRLLLRFASHPLRSVACASVPVYTLTVRYGSLPVGCGPRPS